MGFRKERREIKRGTTQATTSMPPNVARRVARPFCEIREEIK